MQTPIALLGYHHEWSPGSHTLALAGRIENRQRFNDLAESFPFVYEDSLGGLTALAPLVADVHYRNDLEIYTAEAQHMFRAQRFGLIVGARYQSGTVGSFESLALDPSNLLFVNIRGTHSVNDPFERATAYGYLSWEPFTDFVVIGGAAYDDLRWPGGYRTIPVASDEQSEQRVYPKAGFIWTLHPRATIRGMHARNMGGLSLEQSYTLEPVQIAGFPQLFRTVISESLIGSVAAPEFHVSGLAFDFKLPWRTYLNLSGARLESSVSQGSGAFLVREADLTRAEPVFRTEHHRYSENRLALACVKLVKEHWAAGVEYEFSDVNWDTQTSGLLPLGADDHSRLHSLRVFARFQHQSGFYAQVENLSHSQSNLAFPDSEFAQVNVQAGYRWPRKRADISLAALNINDAEPRLHPLSPHAELPREPVFVFRAAFRF